MREPIATLTARTALSPCIPSLAACLLTWVIGLGVIPPALGADPPPVIADLIKPPPPTAKRSVPAATSQPASASATSRGARRVSPTTPSDARVRRTQIEAPPLNTLPTPGAADALAPVPAPNPMAFESGQNISLQAALYGAITGNPDLIALRNSNIASPEAVEVARRLPTTLNPTFWLDIRPWVWIPNDRGGGTSPGQTLVYFSIRQPVELGHQTTHRYAIAQAALTQQQWTVVQAELLALVQTYRFFQTAAYRREKLRVAQTLADFNDSLVEKLRRRLETNPATAADVVLAEVESAATRQQVDVARQDYVVALTDLRNQIGVPETAGTAEPLGEFILPKNIPEIDDQALIEIAKQSRPDIQVARAQVDGACAAVKLARGDRIPTPVIGPQYEKDETGSQFFGFVFITPLPIVNNGKPLVIQREAEYRRSLVTLDQVTQRTVAQVKAAVAKWNQANRLVAQSNTLTEKLRGHVARMERLFDTNVSDLAKLLQARQRLIQLENNQLDALWQATQAQADLLTAMGAPSMIAALHEPHPTSANSAAPVMPTPANPAAPVPAAVAPPSPAASTTQPATPVVRCSESPPAR